MTVKGIGIDIAETKRFFPFSKDRENRFLVSNFSKGELDYCFSFHDPTEHLAGTFAAKEAVVKAIGKQKLLQSTIEIRREKSGMPSVWIANKKQKSIFISISHTKDIATSIAIQQK